MAKREPVFDAFDFHVGRKLVAKYEVLEKLGAGWEGEVYKVREVSTGIERATKFFFPQRNLKGRTAKQYAIKLHKLRHCPILIQYHTQELMRYRGFDITFLVSEYVEGEKLSEFLQRHAGQRLAPFQALHLLHALASGIESIHQMREYHGDLHTENIIIQRYGLGFEVKLIDMFHWGGVRSENIYDDVVDLVKVFYSAIGGAKMYAKQPVIVKNICCGLKRSLILKKYRSAGQLRQFLENLNWD